MSWHTRAFLAALIAGCSVTNKEHCGNLEGDATCSARDKDYPYCNVCIGDNDGCVAAPVDDPSCAKTASSGGSSGSSATEPSSSTSTSSTTGGPTTGTTTSATGSTGTTTSTGTTDTGDSTATATTQTTSGTGSTGAPPMCGDGNIDDQEVCDGDQLGGKKCTDFGTMYGGGTLMCFDNCTFDTSGCCKVKDQACLMPEECCSNNCTLLKCL
jgi:hypothetical protein